MAAQVNGCVSHTQSAALFQHSCAYDSDLSEHRNFVILIKQEFYLVEEEAISPNKFDFPLMEES